MNPSDLEHVVRRLVDRVERSFYGKYLGFVVDDRDPQRRGRLRVLVPEVLGDVVSGWAEPCLPYGGGANFGAYAVPPVTRGPDGGYTTAVWVEFRGGHCQFPLWTGVCWGAPDDASEAPGDADTDAPTPGVHVVRSFAGHSVIADDTPGQERMELRDPAGQRLTFSAPLRDGVKRDGDGRPVTPADAVDYGDFAGRPPTIELTDFAGNNLTLDGDRAAPTLRLTNTSRDGKILQTVELYGASENPRIVVHDHHDNKITLDAAGVRIESPKHSSAIVLGAAGIAQDAPKINLNSGVQGVARREDGVRSTMTEDSIFWSFIPALMGWLATHTHGTGAGPSTPPVLPFPGVVPDKCVGKIIEASDSVLAGG